MTTRDVSNITGALGADVLNSRIPVKVANSAVASYRACLSSAALAQKYGQPIDQSGARVLTVASAEVTP